MSNAFRRLRRSPRPVRRPLRLLAAFALATVAFAPTVGGPADAADGRVFEITPVPERGYFLPGERIDVMVTCLEGESYERVWHDDLGSGGWAGSDGWGQLIDPYAPPGAYEWVIECTNADGEVVDSATFVTEVGPAARLVATVGTVAGECAETTEITVEAGTEVHWCYHLVPDPELEDDIFHEWGWTEIRQQVADTLNGTLGEDVQDGDATLPTEGITSIELGFLSSTVVDEDVDNTGTWSVTFGEYDDDDGWRRFSMADLSATARVIVATEDIEGEPTDGTDEAAPPAAPASPIAAAPAYTG